MTTIEFDQKNYLCRIVGSLRTMIDLFVFIIGFIICFHNLSRNILTFTFLIVPGFILVFSKILSSHRIYIYSIKYDNEYFEIAYLDYFKEKKIRTIKMEIMRDEYSARHYGKLKIFTDNKILYQGETGEYNLKYFQELCKKYPVISKKR